MPDSCHRISSDEEEEHILMLNKENVQRGQLDLGKSEYLNFNSLRPSLQHLKSNQYRKYFYAYLDLYPVPFLDNIRVSMNYVYENIQRRRTTLLQSSSESNNEPLLRLKISFSFDKELAILKKRVKNVFSYFVSHLLSREYGDEDPIFLVHDVSSVTTKTILMNTSSESSLDKVKIINGQNKLLKNNTASRSKESEGKEISKIKAPKQETREELTTEKASNESVDVKPSNETKEENSGAVIDYSDVEIDLDPACPLCQFMRASPCGDIWITWEKCVEYHKSRDEDIVKPCSKFTLDLIDCILKNQDDFPEPLKRQLMGLPPEEDEEPVEKEKMEQNE